MSTEILPRRQALSLLVVVVLAWGFTWIVSKLLLQQMTPLWAVAARSVVGAAALLALGLALRRVAWPPGGWTRGADRRSKKGREKRPLTAAIEAVYRTTYIVRYILSNTSDTLRGHSCATSIS